MTRFIIVCGVVLAAFPAISGMSASDRYEAAIRRFDRAEAAYRSAAPYRTTKDNDALPWSESYLLQAYAVMYRATAQRRYAELLFDRFEAIARDRDDRRRPPAVDAFTRTIRPAWGTAQYTQGRWHVWAVHTGMLCLGPAECAADILSRRTPQTLRKRAQEILDLIDEAMAAHDSEWRWGPRRDEAHMIDPAIGLLPLNQQNAPGMVWLSLYRSVHQRLYRDRAEALGRYFRNRVRITSNGGIDWAYQPNIEGNARGAEDISHAAINVQFAVRLRQAGLVFTDSDLRRIGITWRSVIRKGPGTWADTMNGAGNTNTHVPQAIGRWLDLAPWAPTIRDDAEGALGSLDTTGSAAVLLGMAKLAAQTPKR